MASGLFVGRIHELATLQRAWEEATGGDGRLLVVTGPAGIGKTRLVAELARTAHSDGALVLYGRAVSLTTRLQPLAEALACIGTSLEAVVSQCDDVARETCHDWRTVKNYLTPNPSDRPRP